jgi:hypothetical protein
MRRSHVRRIHSIVTSWRVSRSRGYKEASHREVDTFHRDLQEGIIHVRRHVSLTTVTSHVRGGRWRLRRTVGHPEIQGEEDKHRSASLCFTSSLCFLCCLLLLIRWGSLLERNPSWLSLLLRQVLFLDLLQLFLCFCCCAPCSLQFFCLSFFH